MRLPIDIDQQHGEVHEGDRITFNGKSWRIAKVEPGPSHFGYRVACEAGLPTREALAAALIEVEHTAGCNDPEVVEWASRRGFAYGHEPSAHLPAMLRKADALLAALSSEASVIPLRVTVWLEEEG